MRRIAITRFVLFNSVLLTFVCVILWIYRLATWRWVYYDSVAEETDNLWTSLYIGSKFDIRLALFCLAPVILLSLIFHTQYFRTPKWAKFNTYYLGTVLTLLNLFYVFDIGNYLYLKERINASVLSFLTNPLISGQMMWESYPIIWILLTLTVVCALQIFAVKRIYSTVNQLFFDGSKRLRITYTIAFLLLSALAGYGKWSYYPLRWSEAFFSKNNDLSHLTLNPVLYFANTLKVNATTYSTEETYQYFNPVKNYLGAPNNMAIDFARSYKPLNDSIPEPTNVIVVMMESLGAQPLGLFNNPLKGSPFIDSLATKSWFLPNFYVPRYGTARTVFTSITGLPDVVEDKTASRNPKAINQRVILDQLKGMEKLYFLGGSASWANIRALFTNNVSDIKIYEEGSYEQEDRVDVWGINDGDLFRNANKTLTELHQKNKPFIAYIQTSGYHPPYTVPDQEGNYKRLTTKDISEKEVQKAGFVSLDQYNALRYFDHNLRILFELSKKSGYYKNTVFLLFGDHNGRISPYKHMARPDFETGLGQLHVPFIIHGDMLPKWQDHRMASLMDLYPTIADLLNQPYTNYTLGRSLLRRPKNDNSPTFVFDFFNGSLKPTAILPEHYYFAEKSGNTINSIYPNTKPGYDQADTSFGNQRIKQLDSLAKGMYQSTLYLYFNNKK